MCVLCCFFFVIFGTNDDNPYTQSICDGRLIYYVFTVAVDAARCPAIRFLLCLRFADCIFIYLFFFLLNTTWLVVFARNVSSQMVGRLFAARVRSATHFLFARIERSKYI